MKADLPLSDSLRQLAESELEADESHVYEDKLAPMQSMQNHWHGLIVFVDNPEI